ncbi:MAG: type II toxin-antitoxin system VapC family toxin [Candidatus Bathyarchaeales archaeon]
MIETDVLYAYVKKDDWLKPAATRVISKIVNGELGTVYASRESLHEIYYVSKEEGVSLDELITRTAALTTIENLTFLETTYEIDLLALTIIRQYGISSIFDAYYAATALNQVPDHTIISTDTIFDAIPGIKRIDPREL